MIIDCIADLHGNYPILEGGDLLIVAGDLTATDTFENHCDFTKWLYEQPYIKKIVISGNHDNFFIGTPPHDLLFSTYNEKTGEQKSFASYLCDSGTEFEGLKIWGSPWTKTFPGMNPNCKVFTVDTEEELAEKWALIPDDTDILITHGPIWGMLDCLETGDQETRVGSRSLLKWVASNVNTLKLHVCGHIHQGYGIFDIRNYQDKFDELYTTIFTNASHVNERYEPVNKPIRIAL